MVKSSWLLNSSTLCRDLLLIVLGLEKWVGLDWAHQINPQRWLLCAQILTSSQDNLNSMEGSSYLSLKSSLWSVRKLYWKITDRTNCSDILNAFTTQNTKISPDSSFSSLPWDSSNIPHWKTNIRLVQKLSLGNQNTKINIKWKKLSFFVLTSSYSEGSRPQPAVSCKWGRKSPMLEEHRDVMWWRGHCTDAGKECVILLVLCRHESIWHPEFSPVSITKNTS